MKAPSRTTSALKVLATTAVAGLVLAACATATPYQPAGYNGQRGGYSEQRVESNRYRVTFAGNSVTSREQVEMSLLLRSAELVGKIVARAREKGLILLSCGTYYNVIRFLMPVTIPDAQLEKGIAIVAECFDELA